jgi:MSHA biogenesis protein MshG
MSTFKYRVRDRSGKAIAGTIEAPTIQMAGDQLYSLGYFPISIEEMREAISVNLSDIWRLFKKVKLEEVIVFSQQLSTLYKAGLPLLTGLASITEQVKSENLKGILNEIHGQIEGGSTLHGAMAKYPEAFSSVYVNMVRAGETSGLLGESLDRFVTLADRELQTRKRVRDAIRYPFMVIATMILALIVLLLPRIGMFEGVIPRFARVFSQFHTPLPLPTRIMIAIGTHWYLVFGTLLAILIFIIYLFVTSKGKLLRDKLKNRIPVFSPLFLKVALSRFSYTFAMLNRSGIPILQTLEITSGTVNNNDLSKSIGGIIKKVREGSSLTDAMRESGKFTRLVLQMVSVGEVSGTLDQMLIRITEYYDQEVDGAIKKMSEYVGPMLLVILAPMVLFLALAVFLPWWDMARLFK